MGLKVALTEILPGRGGGGSNLTISFEENESESIV